LSHRDARVREDAGEPEGVGPADVRPIVPPESDDVDELGILGEQLGKGIGIRPVPGVFPAVDDRSGCLQHVLVPPMGIDSSTAIRGPLLQTLACVLPCGRSVPSVTSEPCGGRYTAQYVIPRTVSRHWIRWVVHEIL